MPWVRAPSVDAARYPKLDLLEASWISMQSLDFGATSPPYTTLGSSGFAEGRFKKSNASFDAAGFLAPLSAACLMEPRLLEVDRGTCTPFPKALHQQHGSSAGVLGYLK